MKKIKKLMMVVIVFAGVYACGDMTEHISVGEDGGHAAKLNIVGDTKFTEVSADTGEVEGGFKLVLEDAEFIRQTNEMWWAMKETIQVRLPEGLEIEMLRETDNLINIKIEGHAVHNEKEDGVSVTLEDLKYIVDGENAEKLYEKGIGKKKIEISFIETDGFKFSSKQGDNRFSTDDPKSKSSVEASESIANDGTVRGVVWLESKRDIADISSARGRTVYTDYIQSLQAQMPVGLKVTLGKVDTWKKKFQIRITGQAIKNEYKDSKTVKLDNKELGDILGVADRSYKYDAAKQADLELYLSFINDSLEVKWLVVKEDGSIEKRNSDAKFILVQDDTTAFGTFRGKYRLKFEGQGIGTGQGIRLKDDLGSRTRLLEKFHRAISQIPRLKGTTGIRVTVMVTTLDYVEIEISGAATSYEDANTPVDVVKVALETIDVNSFLNTKGFVVRAMTGSTTEVAKAGLTFKYTTPKIKVRYEDENGSYNVHSKSIPGGTQTVAIFTEKTDKSEDELEGGFLIDLKGGFTWKDPVAEKSAYDDFKVVWGEALHGAPMRIERKGMGNNLLKVSTTGEIKKLNGELNTNDNVVETKLTKALVDAIKIALNIPHGKDAVIGTDNNLLVRVNTKTPKAEVEVKYSKNYTEANKTITLKEGETKENDVLDGDIRFKLSVGTWKDPSVRVTEYKSLENYLNGVLKGVSKITVSLSNKNKNEMVVNFTGEITPTAGQKTNDANDIKVVFDKSQNKADLLNKLKDVAEVEEVVLSSDDFNVFVDERNYEHEVEVTGTSSNSRRGIVTFNTVDSPLSYDKDKLEGEIRIALNDESGEWKPLTSSEYARLESYLRGKTQATSFKFTIDPNDNKLLIATPGESITGGKGQNHQVDYTIANGGVERGSLEANLNRLLVAGVSRLKGDFTLETKQRTEEVIETEGISGGQITLTEGLTKDNDVLSGTLKFKVQTGTWKAVNEPGYDLLKTYFESKTQSADFDISLSQSDTELILTPITGTTGDTRDKTLRIDYADANNRKEMLHFLNGVLKGANVRAKLDQHFTLNTVLRRYIVSEITMTGAKIDQSTHEVILSEGNGNGTTSKENDVLDGTLIFTLTEGQWKPANNSAYDELKTYFEGQTGALGFDVRVNTKQLILTPTTGTKGPTEDKTYDIDYSKTAKQNELLNQLKPLISGVMKLTFNTGNLYKLGVIYYSQIKIDMTQNVNFDFTAKDINSEGEYKPNQGVGFKISDSEYTWTKDSNIIQSSDFVENICNAMGTTSKLKVTPPSKVVTTYTYDQSPAYLLSGNVGQIKHTQIVSGGPTVYACEAKISADGKTLRIVPNYRPNPASFTDRYKSVIAYDTRSYDTKSYNAYTAYREIRYVSGTSGQGMHIGFYHIAHMENLLSGASGLLIKNGSRVNKSIGIASGNTITIKSIIHSKDRF